MDDVTALPNAALLDRLVAWLEPDLLVVVGADRGERVAVACGRTLQVIWVARDAAQAQAAAARFAHDPQVTVLPGSADAVLQGLRAQLQTGKVIYWLDACADASSGHSLLAAELAAIAPLNPSSLVWVDTAGLSHGGELHFHDVVTALLRLSPDHRLVQLDGAILLGPAAMAAAVAEVAEQQRADAARAQAAQAATLAHLHQDLLEKEAIIQQMWRDQRTSPLYWLRLIGRLTILRSKNLVQYAPRPLRLPPHYAQTAVTVPSPPTISIVTPSYQQGEYLARTVESVLGQGYPHLEYVVQDGGSTDSTPAVLARYQDRLSHVTSAPDDGQADAINRGFAHTHGEIMAWLNSDDILLPGALAYVAHYFATHPDVDVVYGHRIQIDAQDREIGRWVLPPHDTNILAWADYVPQETLFWRRRIWEKVGGHVDVGYRFALDWELLMRFQRADAKFVRLPRFLAAFRVHDAQKTSAYLQSLGIAEMMRLREKVHGRRVHAVEIQSHIVGYLARAAVYDRLVAWRVLRH